MCRRRAPSERKGHLQRLFLVINVIYYVILISYSRIRQMFTFAVGSLFYDA